MQYRSSATGEFEFFVMSAAYSLTEPPGFGRSAPSRRTMSAPLVHYDQQFDEYSKYLLWRGTPRSSDAMRQRLMLTRSLVCQWAEGEHRPVLAGTYRGRPVDDCDVCASFGATKATRVMRMDMTRGKYSTAGDGERFLRAIFEKMPHVVRAAIGRFGFVLVAGDQLTAHILDMAAIAMQRCRRLWTAEIDHSPLDVVAWHGNYAPYRYDLESFVAFGTVTFDPPDPSIYTVLTAPTAIPGTANADFLVFPPRWIVAEHTFRPPSFHRNVSSEFMTLIKGSYHGKSGEGFAPGGASIHNCMTGHGPDAATYEKAVVAEDEPEYLANTLAVMLETQLVIRPTKFALESQALQSDYFEAWQGLEKHFKKPPAEPRQ
jgi:hypothetical protein